MRATEGGREGVVPVCLGGREALLREVRGAGLEGRQRGKEMWVRVPGGCRPPAQPAQPVPCHARHAMCLPLAAWRFMTMTNMLVSCVTAVRADRMRGGRNKFGPMYKRDRARKLQMLRQRQLTHPGSLLSGGRPPTTSGIAISYASPGYSTPSSHIHIKEEIQSPFLSSSTSSPDSSPSPMTGLGGLVAGSSGVSGLVAASGPVAPIIAGPDPSLWATNTQSNAAASVTTAAPPSGGVGGGGGGGGSAGGGRTVAAGGPRIPLIIRELVETVDDQEWQSSLFSLLQNQTYNQCEVDLFELLCKVLDQNLFAQVDWARNSCYFKDLKVSFPRGQVLGGEAGHILQDTPCFSSLRETISWKTFMTNTELFPCLAGFLKVSLAA